MTLLPGAMFGSVITLPLTGLFCEYGPDGGWPAPFYFFGSLGVVWFLAWMLLVSEPPKVDAEATTRPKVLDSRRGLTS